VISRRSSEKPPALRPPWRGFALRRALNPKPFAFSPMISIPRLLVTSVLLGVALARGADPIDFHARARQLVGQMTLEEKASLTSGRDFWSTKPIARLGLPSIFMTDGPHGLRKTTGAHLADSVPATCFPTASALASTWNVDLLREVGVALGDECQANDVQILLGPGANMKRSPLGGRNFEYFSEDPLLAGKMAAALIGGVQSRGVGTSLKHFAANNQEFERMISNSMIDERTLREIYLPAFEIAVREGAPWSVMCSYNLLNGVPVSHNALLLDQILKKQWGFGGIVVSDWGAVSDRVAGIKAGLNLEMPSSMGRTDAQVVAAVRAGQLSEARLDELVTEMVALTLRAHDAHRVDSKFDPAAHQALARRVGGESVVLLKNAGGLLPLDLTKRVRVAVIGGFAQTPRYQGAGSSQVRPTQLDNLLAELKKLAAPEVTLTFAAGYEPDGATTDTLVAEAVQAARAADVALIVAGLPDSYESEGFDRAGMDLPAGHNRLIAAVAAAQPRSAVVLMNGSAVAMPWAAAVPAIVEGWLGGQAGGGALADVLTGHVNPSGKLSESFPLRLEDTPAYLTFPGRDGEAIYGEGVFIGYRYYDAKKVAPLFPFGHGLSYTTFAYTALRADAVQVDDEAGTRVHVTVKNTGPRAGQEVVQLYVRERAPRVRRPERELRAFAKVALAPGEEKSVTFTLARRDFAYWDSRIHDWAVRSGTFDVQVGGSSRDLPLAVALEVKAKHVVYPLLTRSSMLKAFAETPNGKKVYDEILQGALASMGLGGELSGTSEEIAAKKKTRAMLTVFIEEMQAWKMVAMSRGAITEEKLTELLARANAQP
jgi:beta-glucosidase